MCRTTDSSLKSSNTLNNTGVWSLIELASLYTVPLSAVNGLSRLTTTSNGHARPIRNFRIGPWLSNRIESERLIRIDSNLEASHVPRYDVHRYSQTTSTSTKSKLIRSPQLLPTEVAVARLTQRTRGTLVYNTGISQGSAATRLRCGGIVNDSSI